MERFTDELEGCTEAERSTARRREVAVNLFGWMDRMTRIDRLSGKEKRMRSDMIAAELMRLLPLLGIKASRATLYKWRKAYRDKGVVGLVDLRGRDDRPRYLRFFRYLSKLYCENFITTDVAHWAAKTEAEKQGWQVPTIRESEQYIKANVRPGVTTEPGE